MRKTAATLADGREIVYYDRDSAPERVGIDRRDLGRRPRASELRFDPLLGAPVMIAGHRQDRTYFPAPCDCPLCPSRDGRETEVPAPDYEVAVLENRFPALSGEQASVLERASAGELSAGRPGAGRCEVVCFSPDHDASFADLSPEQVSLVLGAWTDRSAVLGAMAAVEQVFCFENRGEEIGVTLQHPHGQIYAYPFVTPRTSRVAASLVAYHRRTGRNLFDDVLAAERGEPAGRSRVVATNRSWIAFVPYAARWPYEVHLYPNRRVPDLVALCDEEREDFPSIYLDLLGRFDRLFDTKAPYISAWHQAPIRELRSSFALHLELFTTRRSSGKLKYLAASESAMDAFANDVLPELAASRLRELA